MKLTNKLKAIIIVVAVACLFIVAVGAITYLIGVSNSAAGTVSGLTIQIPLNLTLQPTAITEGEDWTLIATATGANAANAVGKIVTFKEGTTTVGTASIQQVGSEYKAEITLTPSVGSHTYLAGP